MWQTGYIYTPPGRSPPYTLIIPTLLTPALKQFGKIFLKVSICPFCVRGACSSEIRSKRKDGLPRSWGKELLCYIAPAERFRMFISHTSCIYNTALHSSSIYSCIILWDASIMLEPDGQPQHSRIHYQHFANLSPPASHMSLPRDRLNGFLDSFIPGASLRDVQPFSDNNTKWHRNELH